MQIWVDADACPVDAKEVLYKVSKRLQIRMTLVANQMMWVPKSNLIQFELVGAGADVADRRIVELLNPGDLVISSDLARTTVMVIPTVEALVIVRAALALLQARSTRH